MKNKQEELFMDHLRMHGKMELKETMELLDISESTARRLFARLEQQEKVIRIFGGVQLATTNSIEYSFERLAKRNTEEKQAIAKIAAQLVEDGDVLYCDGGTTVLAFCMNLVKRVAKEPMNIHVYTNSVAALEVLSESIPSVILIGGEYRPKRKDFCGYIAETSLSKIHMTKSFLGTDGCDRNDVFTTTDFETARLCEMAIKNSRETYILCDSSKFANSEMIGFAEFSQVDKVITDDQITASMRARFEAAEIEVVAVGSSDDAI